MIHVRATAKLLKRLRLPAKLPEPEGASSNPLGEWYADIDFIDREPFVLLLNAATGVGMVVPGRAAELRRLHEHAHDQIGKLFRHFGLSGPLVDAEIAAWSAAPTYARTRDRSLLGSMRTFRDDAWRHFAYENRSLPDAAARQWEGFFRHPSLVDARFSPNHHRNWHRPLELACARLGLPPPPPRSHAADQDGNEVAPLPPDTLIVPLRSLAPPGILLTAAQAEAVLARAEGRRAILLDFAGVGIPDPSFVSAMLVGLARFPGIDLLATNIPDGLPETFAGMAAMLGHAGTRH